MSSNKIALLNEILTEWLAEGGSDSQVLRARLGEAGLTTHATTLDQAMDMLNGGHVYVRIDVDQQVGGGNIDNIFDELPARDDEFDPPPRYPADYEDDPDGEIPF